MLPAPLLLKPDNFTAAQRTPWGGHRIVSELKPFLAGRDERVGESWELSIAELPSQTVDGRDLRAVLQGDPEGWLGEQARQGCSLLVKLLDADAHLSLQIHPDDRYAGLAPNESGKPEAWYVVAHEPGAGVYLGFLPGVDRTRVEGALQRGEDLTNIMAFVEVQVGDFLVIDAGTPHAVGAGVTLVEPQRVMPGRKGVTYRYWDWNRTYDGKPRPLHVTDALAVTDWSLASDPLLLSTRRMRAEPPTLDAAPGLQPLCGPGYQQGVPCDALRVARLQGTGAFNLPAWPQLRGLTVLSGSVTLDDGLVVDAGYTAVLPAGGGYRARLEATHAIVSAAP